MIQCFSGWGGVWIATWSRLLDPFPPVWSVILLSKMLIQGLKGFKPWFWPLHQGRYVRLLVWWWSTRLIDLRCNACMKKATVVRLFSVLEPLISYLYVWSMGLYTCFRWHRSEISWSGTWATRLTWMHSICFTCRLFNLMLEVIISAIYRYLMSVYSGCLNFVMGVVQACV